MTLRHAACTAPVGHFPGSSVDFGGGALDSAGGQDVFVASYDPAGTFRWAKRHGAEANEHGLFGRRR